MPRGRRPAGKQEGASNDLFRNPGPVTGPGAVGRALGGGHARGGSFGRCRARLRWGLERRDHHEGRHLRHVLPLPDPHHQRHLRQCRHRDREHHGQGRQEWRGGRQCQRRRQDRDRHRPSRWEERWRFLERRQRRLQGRLAGRAPQLKPQSVGRAAPATVLVMPGFAPGIAVFEPSHSTIVGVHGFEREHPARSKMLTYAGAVTAGVLAALALQIYLAGAGFDLGALWDNLLSAKPRELRTTGPWWAVAGMAFLVSGATAAALVRLPLPWRFRPLRWV